MRCDGCGRMLMMGAQWLVRVPPKLNRMLKYRTLAEMEAAPWPDTRVYLFCWECAFERGLEKEGEGLPFNKGAAKYFNPPREKQVDLPPWPTFGAYASAMLREMDEALTRLHLRAAVRDDPEALMDLMDLRIALNAHVEALRLSVRK